MLLAIYVKTLTFSPEHSSKKRGLRGKQTSRPNAWPPEDDDDEDLRRAYNCIDALSLEILPAQKAKVVELSPFVC